MIFSIFFIGLASGQNPYTGDIWPQPQSHFLGQKVYEIEGANFKIVASSGIVLNRDLYCHIYRNPPG